LSEGFSKAEFAVVARSLGSLQNKFPSAERDKNLAKRMAALGAAMRFLGILLVRPSNRLCVQSKRMPDAVI
jgi:hypothetical protein